MSDIGRRTAKVEAMLREAIDRQITGALYYGTTNAEPAEPTTLNAKDFIRDIKRMVRNFRRTAVTFVVDAAHEGSMIGYPTPEDGWRYEMNFAQAQRLHEQWPLKLHKVLNETAAEFVPGSQFDSFFPKVLPYPPFEIPSEDDDTPA